MSDLREQIKAAWQHRKVAASLRAFAHRMTLEDDWEQITHICAYSADMGRTPTSQGYLDFMELRRIGLQSPMSAPYFRVLNESDLVHVKLVVPHLRAWEFRTAKRLQT